MRRYLAAWLFVGLSLALGILTLSLLSQEDPNHTDREIERAISNALNYKTSVGGELWIVKAIGCEISWQRTTLASCQNHKLETEQITTVFLPEVERYDVTASGQTGVLSIGFDEYTTNVFEQALKLIYPASRVASEKPEKLQSAHIDALGYVKSKGVISGGTFRSCAVNNGLNISLTAKVQIVSKRSELNNLKEILEQKTAQCKKSE
ncbi:hypothetical protein [Shimia sp. R9_3]|uniref:hypothetical protein n=1 Tax=Shimia sp. R9_3 TaxID=2821113 RepID=UPI001ADB39EB|nr:hypothetical protein [Shimia sp. R9_3]MBO9403219.1 hypothetical protein [Shimia sp. R9_3]